MRVEGLEPSATVWKTVNLTINRYPHLLKLIYKISFNKQKLNINYTRIVLYKIYQQKLILSIYLTKNNILSTKYCNNICNHMTTSHEIYTL